MAIRYCGGLKITLFWNDNEQMYRCLISHGRARAAVFVGAPASGFGPGVAYDGSVAYDRTAHAAVSFATSGDDDTSRELAEHAWMDHRGEGWAISRGKPKGTAHADGCFACGFRAPTHARTCTAVL